MILYLDTSALIKAFVQEDFYLETREIISLSKIISSSTITSIEVHAAFARLRRENKITNEQHNDLKRLFIEDWENYLKIEPNTTVMKMAWEFAEVFGLRAYDSLQLASANYLLKQSKMSVIFACFDIKLNMAAHALGLELLDIESKK